jgi:hypothetical protein
MTKVLIFAVEVEDDQDLPDIGTYFDVSNNMWDFMDSRLSAVINPDEANHDMYELIKESL